MYPCLDQLTCCKRSGAVIQRLVNITRVEFLTGINIVDILSKIGVFSHDRIGEALGRIRCPAD